MADVTTVRMPEELKQLLQTYAKQTGISVNALIVYILWDWVRGKK